MPFLLVLVATCCAVPLALLAARSLIKPKKQNDIERLVEQRRKAARKHFEG